MIVGRTTGEGHLMNWDEHIMLTAHTVNRFSNDLVIIGNTGSNNTRESFKATQRIRLDCVSGANHNLNRLLDKPGLTYIENITLDV